LYLPKMCRCRKGYQSLPDGAINSWCVIAFSVCTLSVGVGVHFYLYTCIEF
jgi:hypothetical protein